MAAVSGEPLPKPGAPPAGPSLQGALSLKDASVSSRLSGLPSAAGTSLPASGGSCADVHGGKATAATPSVSTEKKKRVLVDMCLRERSAASGASLEVGEFRSAESAPLLQQEAHTAPELS